MMQDAIFIILRPRFDKARKFPNDAPVGKHKKDFSKFYFHFANTRIKLKHIRTSPLEFGK